MNNYRLFLFNYYTNNFNKCKRKFNYDLHY